MQAKGWRAAVVASAALGLASVGAAPAFAALDPSVVEAVEAPEVVEVAQGIAALLESAEPGAEEQELVAALHRYLSDSVYEVDVLQDALAVVLAGDWTETQYSALRSIFAEYAPADVEPPSGGGGFMPPPPAVGGVLAATAAEAETSTLEAESATVSHSQLQAATAPPPPPAGGGGSDYRP